MRWDFFGLRAMVYEYTVAPMAFYDSVALALPA